MTLETHNDKGLAVDTQMLRRLAGTSLLGIMLGMAHSAAEELTVTDREETITPQSGYVAVDLNKYANDNIGIVLSEKQATVNGIPFDLIDGDGADNLFMKNAGWAKVKEDPSSYISSYDKIPTKDNTNRFVFSIPVADYSGVWLLAATDNDETLSDIITFRIGAMGTWKSSDQVLSYTYEARVPRFNESGTNDCIPAGSNALFLVYIPIEEAFAQDFAHRFSLDVDITKKLRLAIRRPDPCRFQIRPLGLPSGIHIFGMTFAISPLQMKVKSKEPGGIFTYPHPPAFTIAVDFPFHVKSVPSRNGVIIEAVATDYYGSESRTTRTIGITPLIAQSRHLVCELPLATSDKLGFYKLTLKLTHGNDSISRNTTFAVLPPDTRRYRDEGFLGTWSFDNHAFCTYDPDLIGTLYHKAGLRYGMFHYTEKERRKYNVIKGNERKFRQFDKAEEARILEDLKNPATAKLERFMIFHESSISGSHVMRIPDLFSGQTYKFDEKEQARFSDLWDKAQRGIAFIKSHSPGTEIYFGNTEPLLLEEFLRHDFPAELLGSFGCAAGSFARIPETQPPDWVACNPDFWMSRTLLNHYGYKDTPLRIGYEWCYANTNPGNLSMNTQAAYYIRHIVHALAWGIPIVRPAVIADVGDSYYFSNWGAAGLCFARPRISPKPSYVAIANLTQILDGAVFSRIVETGSPVVYAVEFKRKDNASVTALWTIRGKREISLTAKDERNSLLTDMMGNEQELRFVGGIGSITISEAPVYITTLSPILSITPGAATLAARPQDERFTISPLDAFADWTEEKTANKELEMYNPLCPRRKGTFTYTDVPEFEGEKQIMGIEPQTPVPGSPYLPMYSVLSLKKGVEIPGMPTSVGLIVNGNGGWGRFIFELEDAGGQRWISIGAENKGKPTRWMADRLTPEEFTNLSASNMSDWNTNDSWKKSYINFGPSGFRVGSPHM